MPESARADRGSASAAADEQLAVDAVLLTGRRTGMARALNAATAALAFLAFATTDFVGMAQLGIIGSGGIAQSCHIPGYLSVPDQCEVVALCDSYEPNLKHASALWHLPAGLHQ